MSGRVIRNSHLQQPFTPAKLKAVEKQPSRMTTHQLNILKDKMNEEQLHTLRTNTPSRNASRTPLYSAITSGVSSLANNLKTRITKNQETQFIPLGMSPTKGATGGYNSRKPKKPTVLTKKPKKPKKVKAKK